MSKNGFPDPLDWNIQSNSDELLTRQDALRRLVHNYNHDHERRENALQGQVDELRAQLDELRSSLSAPTPPEVGERRIDLDGLSSPGQDDVIVALRVLLKALLA